MSVEVVDLISYKEAEGKTETIGGLGGWFSDGNRWKDYVENFADKGREYAEAIRKYIVEHDIKRGGDWHQREGTPLFSDGTVASFSYRAWGDIMAAIWSEEEDQDYNYMSFYMDY